MIDYKMGEIKKAVTLGQEAFKKGLPCAPALDGRVMEILKGAKVGEGKHILKAWIDGWNKENLNGPKT